MPIEEELLQEQITKIKEAILTGNITSYPHVARLARSSTSIGLFTREEEGIIEYIHQVIVKLCRANGLDPLRVGWDVERLLMAIETEEGNPVTTMRIYALLNSQMDSNVITRDIIDALARGYINPALLLEIEGDFLKSRLGEEAGAMLHLIAQNMVRNYGITYYSDVSGEIMAWDAIDMLLLDYSLYNRSMSRLRDYGVLDLLEDQRCSITEVIAWSNEEYDIRIRELTTERDIENLPSFYIGETFDSANSSDPRDDENGASPYFLTNLYCTQNSL